jgi:hypothetical protein
VVRGYACIDMDDGKDLPGGIYNSEISDCQIGIYAPGPVARDHVVANTTIRNCAEPVRYKAERIENVAYIGNRIEMPHEPRKRRRPWWAYH